MPGRQTGAGQDRPNSLGVEFPFGLSFPAGSIHLKKTNRNPSWGPALYLFHLVKRSCQFLHAETQQLPSKGPGTWGCSALRHRRCSHSAALLPGPACAFCQGSPLPGCVAGILLATPQPR